MNVSYAAIYSKIQVFSEPQWEELLPPPQPGQKPLTLIVSLDDLLVTSTWDVRALTPLLAIAWLT
jgi:hypothetical protein